MSEFITPKGRMWFDGLPTQEQASAAVERYRKDYQLTQVFWDKLTSERMEQYRQAALEAKRWHDIAVEMGLTVVHDEVCITSQAQLDEYLRRVHDKSYTPGERADAGGGLATAARDHQGA